MAYYTRKPELVEAIQWTGSNLQEIKDFVGKMTYIYIAFKNPQLSYQICYMDLVNYTGDESNIVTLYIGPGDLCVLRLMDYLILHDCTESPELFPLEAMNEYRFKGLYQPDSCSLDGSGCE